MLHHNRKVMTVARVCVFVWAHMNVSHTAGRDEALLQSFVLKAQILLTLSAPGQLQQTLDDLWMTP